MSKWNLFELKELCHRARTLVLVTFRKKLGTLDLGRDRAQQSKYTRVYITIELSYDRGGMSNLAYICTMFFNFVYVWDAQTSAGQASPKFKTVAPM